MLGQQVSTSRRTMPAWRSRQGAVRRHSGRLLRFGVVGLLGVGLNTLILTLLVEIARLHYLPAAALATESTIIANFALNDRWTFRASRTTIPWLHRLKRYNLIALGGLVISLLVLALLSDLLGIYYVLANLVGIAAATLWNYTVNARLTYALPAAKEERRTAASRRERAFGLAESTAIGD